jgi:ABC-type multidrug transport system fused ATPase/permease subunit
MWSGADLASPYLIKVAIDQAILPRRPAVLNLVVLAYLGLAVLKMSASKVQYLSAASVGQPTLDAIRRRAFTHVLRLPFWFYQRERSGGIVARVVGDVNAASGLVSSAAADLASDLITFAGIAAVLVVLDWRLALETLVVAPLGLAAAAWFTVRSRAAWPRVRDRASEATAVMHEVIAGAREIQAHGGEALLARVSAANRDERSARNTTVVTASLFFPGVELISAIALVAVIGFGGPRVLAGQLGIGTFTAFLLYLDTLFGPVFSASRVYDIAQSGIAGARRITALLALPPTITQPRDPVRLPCPHGHLRLAGVGFAYPAPDGTEGPPVLHDVSLDVPAGTTLALVGHTGAGKSTIARLILRFYDPQAGQVSLDGVNLRELSLPDLRRAISFSPQEGFLFAGTIADNILFGRPGASMAQVMAAVTSLAAWPLINRLPAGLDTEVGEHGDALASGERQMVALLRAWVADPAVLVLDEATSHLDSRSDDGLRHALATLRRGRTTVVIAHRMSSVLEADQVAVIASGRVMESGPPTRLLQASGHFSSLYHRWLSNTEDEDHAGSGVDLQPNRNAR